MEAYGPEGKARRKHLKEVFLGILYGKQSNAIAEALQISKAEAQELLNTVYDNFPKLKLWIESSTQQLKALGYVQTAYGRKRRLTDVKLPTYTFEHSINPNAVCPKDIVTEWTKKLDKAFGKEAKEKVIHACEVKTGWHVVDNSWKIMQAERQGINAMVQGTAADIGKLAFIAISEDEQIKKLGARIVVPIHDKKFVVVKPLDMLETPKAFYTKVVLGDRHMKVRKNRRMLQIA